MNSSQLIIDNTINIGEVKDKYINMSCDEKHIFGVIKNSPCTIDEIGLELNIDKSTIMEVLFSMELKGMIRCIAGKYSF